MTKLTYEEAQKRVEELPGKTKKNAMEKNSAFYDWLGCPGNGGRVIHVAGTNGKGSVCAYLNSVLTGAGYHVGMFTSPHLMDIRERLRLDGVMIGKRDFAMLYKRLEEETALFSESGKLKDSKYCPSYFETLTFMFLLWMERERPDFILLETGMGGRRDATNVIQRPYLTVITRIALDHCEYLGGTLAEIAGEKAGIMKKGVPAVCLNACEEVRRVFVERAESLSAPLALVSEKEVAFYKNKKNYVDFFMNSAYYKYIECTLATCALYQAENAAVAVRALEYIGRDTALTKEQIEDGLSSMRWEARMEETGNGVMIDGAHNPDGIRAFTKSAAEDGCKGRRLLLFGASSDKQTGEMMRILTESRLFDEMAAACIDSSRSLDARDLNALVYSADGKGAKVFDDAVCAIDWLSQKRRKADRVYVTGSLYLAGEIKRYLKERNSSDRSAH